MYREREVMAKFRAANQRDRCVAKPCRVNWVAKIEKWVAKWRDEWVTKPERIGWLK